jgi:hypothetical protein
MDWLRIVCGLIAVSIWLILFLQTFRFYKEFKEAINDDRSISKKFVKRLNKKLSREIVLVIVASILSLIAIFLS